MLSEIGPLLEELKRSAFYLGIVWAGGYPGFSPTPFSDIDLYAITANDGPDHWVAERFGDRRVELTFFSAPKWEVVLRREAQHPKHHFTFLHGQVIHDPLGLCREMRAIAEDSRSRFKTTSEEMEHLRYLASISKDKLRSFAWSNRKLHARMASGNAYQAAEILCRFWVGYSLTATQNI